MCSRLTDLTRNKWPPSYLSVEHDAPKSMPTDPDMIVIAKCREVLATESQYGHSDLSDFLSAYLKGEDSLAQFLWNCDVTWLGSKAPPPKEDNHNENHT